MLLKFYNFSYIVLISVLYFNCVATHLGCKNNFNVQLSHFVKWFWKRKEINKKKIFYEQMMDRKCNKKIACEEFVMKISRGSIINYVIRNFMRN